MHSGCILVGDTGSGKSITGLAYYYICNGGNMGSLQTYNWEPMHSPKDLYIITTPKKRDEKEWDLELMHFGLTTDEENNGYANRVVVDSWNNIKKYTEVKGAFFIFDEDRVTGSGAWSKAFIKISKSNEWIILTATPGDTYMDYVPVFIANGYFKNRTDFYNNHVVWKKVQNIPIVDRYYDTGILNKYKRQVQIRLGCEKHTKSHVTELWADYDKELFKQVYVSYWNVFEDRPCRNVSERGACVRRVVFGDWSRYFVVKEWLDEHPKTIIFYSYDFELDILRELVNDGYTVAEWNVHKHEKCPVGHEWVYLVNYAAGAEAWQCTTTDSMLFFSQSYSYKQMKQASGRINRRNTPYDDLYYGIIRSRAPLDILIRRCLVEKKDFNEQDFLTLGGKNNV